MGYMLLAGRSGIGRRICVKLAAQMLGMDLVSLHVTSGYGIREFSREMR